MLRLMIAGTVLLALVTSLAAGGQAGQPTRVGDNAPKAKAAASADETLRARVVDIQQTLDRILADTTPAPSGTSGTAAGVATDSAAAPAVTVDRARLLQLRRQLDALLVALTKK